MSDLRTCLHKGDGPPPGHLWNVINVDLAYDEASKLLDESQYHHVADLFRQLAREADPTHPLVISIDAVEDFHELRDKGGVLGKKNVRVFFYVDKASKAIVILGVILKKNERSTLQADKIRMRSRLQKYLRGEYGVAEINDRRVGSGNKGEAG